MNIIVKSRVEIERNNNIKQTHVIISIYTPFDKPPMVVINPLTRFVFQLAFDDFDEPGPSATRVLGRELVLFNNVMAKEIVEFVDRFKDVECIVCHCDAGVSRSAGVAAALSKFYNGTDDEYFSGETSMYSNKRYVPNMRVYRTLLNKLNEQ
jgi:predicted protein tyrosine phosphatase